MAHGEVVIRFEKLSFEYSHNKPILDEVDFSIRRGMKVTIMGQNGAGKSTLFSLITGANQPESGRVILSNNLTVALSRQVIPRDELELSVRDFFAKCFKEKVYDIDPRIDEVLEVVNLVGHEKVHDKLIKSFSGGQQARLLLASALIQEPDILLLDEPTNNLDKAGIAHLTDFLVAYNKTVIVISHDAAFLNAFTDAVLYLDVYTRKIEQYVGDYNDVRDQITRRMEIENRKNAQLSKEILAKKEQANAFAMKGGNLRAVAKRMRDLAAELEEEKVDVRKEDRTIKAFTIPCQPDINGDIITIDTVSILKNGEIKNVPAGIKLRKNKHLLLSGPNGIGKSTLLESLASGNTEGSKIQDEIRVGYYRQDFSTLNFDETVYKSLADVSFAVTGKIDEEKIRATAGGFLITGEMVKSKIGSLSEGQKGLVAFARLVLEQPGLLILDEPTNHINFRHLPVIAKALDQYQGAMILVSHVPEFVEQIRIDDTLELDK
ncbi:MAG: ABC-F family ATP-binding cassette domain-containing protein [Candidatus Pacebacteria bacterium]|nr:ABC-F family ATP-binding cassette domain-containing protein [Candidatus Paceibacterota bacterium]